MQTEVKTEVETRSRPSRDEVKTGVETRSRPETRRGQTEVETEVEVEVGPCLGLAWPGPARPGLGLTASASPVLS